jgi:ABC-type transport system substrate-binding protein
MLRRLAILTALAAALSTGALTGCSRAPREPGVVRLTQESDASSLDPAKAYDTTCIPYVRVLYRGLVDYDDKAVLRPEVARSYTVSPDGKTYTFKLRPDVYFHSGERVVAEDFRYSLERVLDPATASDGQTFYSVIEGADEFVKDRENPPGQRKYLHPRGIEVEGEDTLRFRLKKADVTFLNTLALPFAYAVSRKHIESLQARGLDISEHPNGCGPYRLREWVHDGWITLERFPKHFRPDLPRAQTIKVQLGNSAALQIMRFEQGQTDLLPISDANAPDFLRLNSDPQWKPWITHAPMMDVRYITLNCEMKPFTDKRVRQAMNHAIDRRRIVAFLAGRGTLAKGVLPPQMPGFDPQLRGYDYNPDKARALLREAGLEGKFPRLELWYSTAEPWYEKAAQSVQADLRKVGANITIKGVRYAELKAKAGSREGIEMAMMGWLQDFTDPANFFDPLLNSRSITPTASVNRAFYSNPQVDRLLNEALTESNGTKRLSMYREAEKIIVEDAPWVFLHHTERYAVQQPWVKGFALHPMWSQRLEYIQTS